MMFANTFQPVHPFMWLSSTARQALHAVLCIAGNGDGGPVRVDEIAAAIGCPRNYLSKTLYALTLSGVLRSRRGPGGGFQLAVPATDLTLDQVIRAFEPAGERRCLLGRPTCTDADACAAHGRWSCVARDAEVFFQTTTIAELLGSHPIATATTRTESHVVRHPNPRSAHGSRGRRA